MDSTPRAAERNQSVMCLKVRPPLTVCRLTLCPADTRQTTGTRIGKWPTPALTTLEVEQVHKVMPPQHNSGYSRVPEMCEYESHQQED